MTTDEKRAAPGNMATGGDDYGMPQGYSDQTARALLAAGLPVIVCTPCPGWGKPGVCPRHETGRTDLHHPAGWQHLTATDCDLSRFRPGVDALALVTGHGIDGVDVDTKDGRGGSVEHLPPIKRFGVTRTPSGGEHYPVPSTGVGNIGGLRTETGFVGDYRGNSPGLLYLPGSARPKYPGIPYAEVEPWDIPGLLASEPDDDLRAALLVAGGSQEPAAPKYMDDSPERPEGEGVHPYAASAIREELSRLDELSVLGWLGPGWDDTVFEVACNLIEFANSRWSGYSLEDAKNDLLDRAPVDEEWGVRQNELKWDSAMKKVNGAGRQPPSDRLGDPVEDFGPVKPKSDALPGASWLPVDLNATLDGLLDGSLHRPEPEVGGVLGGGALFYKGRVNGIHGDSNAGKTWTALAAVRDVLERGRSAAYIDLEDNPIGILERLLALGVDPDGLRSDRFVYIQPDERLGDGLTNLLAGVAGRELVVIDSTGESLAMEGAKPNDDDDVARWFRMLPRRVAASGPAVVVLDHMPKANGGELWPIGSHRKRAAINGAQYLQEVRQPFSADSPGYSILKCAKDRHGYYRQGQVVAALRVDPEVTGLVTLRTVSDSTMDPALVEAQRQDEVWSDVERALRLHGELSTNQLADACGRSKVRLGPLLTGWLESGEITQRPGPNRRKLYSLPSMEA